MELFTGTDFFADTLGVPEDNFKTAFSFYSGTYPYIPRDFWAEFACSGIAIGVSENKWNQGFFNSGYLSFDGNSLLALENEETPSNKRLFLSDSTIFLSFERFREGNEVLMSSVNSGINGLYSGFCLGVNEANKLYFKYWNSVDGAFTFTSKQFLSKKNLIFLNKSESNLTIGRFDNNKLAFNSEIFPIYKNNMVESNELVLGGYHSQNNPGYLNKNRAPWAVDQAENFSGIIDKYYHIFNLPSIYRDNIVSGFFAKPTSLEGYTEVLCYETGFFEQSGSFTFEKTGVFASGFISGEEVITGYSTFESGYTYFGLIGYENVTVGEYIDQCKITHPIIESVPISGFITDYEIIKLPIFATIEKTGSVDIDLSGFVYREETVPVTQTICDDRFFATGDFNFVYDTGYLGSLSYNKYYFTGNDGDFSWFFNLELYSKPFSIEEYKYNRNSIKSELTDNYWVDEEYSDKKYFEFFSEGLNLIESGFSLQANGYEETLVPNRDYFLAGNLLYSGDSIKEQSAVLYDYQETPQGQIDIFNYDFIFNKEFRQRIFTGKNFKRAFLFRNGLKLRGEDFFIPQYSVLQWPDSGYATSGIEATGYNVSTLNSLTWGNIAYGSGIFAAMPVERIPLAASINDIVLSYDGVDWFKSSNFPNIYRFRALNFVNDRFIAFKGPTPFYSFDGISWLPGSFPSNIPSSGNFPFSEIAYGKNKFISFRRDNFTNFGVLSTDGVNWTQIPRPVEPININKIIYAGDDINGRFVATCGNDSAGERESISIYSMNGETWNVAIMPTAGEWLDIAHGNSVTIAIGLRLGSTAIGAISYNTGTTWSSFNILSQLWNSIIYANDMFLVLNRASGAYSYDGVSWNGFPLTNLNPGLPNPPASFRQHRYSAFGKEKFVSLYRYPQDSIEQTRDRTGICLEVFDSFALFNSISNTQTTFRYKDYGDFYQNNFGEFSNQFSSNNFTSQAYFEGKRKQLSSDYFEISNFELFSGYLETPSEKNIIYNTEDGFLETL
jgi:hypothetical protein